MDYIPQKSGDLITFFTKIVNQIDSVKEALGLTDEQVAAIKAYCLSGINKVQAVEDTWATYQGAVETKDAMDVDGETKALRAIIAKLKTPDGYTSSIGAMLGIVGVGNNLDMQNYKASLSGSVQGDVVRLKFVKSGADGVNIYKRKKGNVQWDFLARDTASPYDDHITIAVAGQPEHWEYIAYGVKKDMQFGAPSDIIQILYGSVA